MFAKTMLPLLAACALAGAAWADESWLYVLQDPDPGEIAEAGFRHAIIDYSRDGTEKGTFNGGEIKLLRDAGMEALGYFSIGEAETYRFYWKPEWKDRPPVWLGRENPDWKGNYKVRYWNTEWRDMVLLPYLKRLVAQGFDGVYLDIVDGYEYWGDDENFKPGAEQRLPDDPADEAEAARRMIKLLAWIKSNGNRLGSKSFAVFPQNAEGLLAYDAPAFLAAINGVGVESLWWEKTRRRPLAEVNSRLSYLRKIRDAGKRVIVLDYLDDGSGYEGANRERMDEFLRLCREERFGHYIGRTNQELDIINIIPPVQP